MTPARAAAAPAAPPPEIPGHTWSEHLRSGGFADVHLYRQLRPARPVAVKVMKVGTADPSHFDDEANRIAQLGQHPYVVTIHAVAVADDGRPYLVMEYCPGGTLGDRCRGGRTPVPEVLDVAVKLSSAVHAVHLAGILHRDIKPANVLLMGPDPRLTDFGISAPATSDDQPTGLSLPWAAPEQFVEGSVADARTEVWSLGATVHALLTGRSPFAQPGSSELAHVTRIQRDPRPATGRADVPASLERFLDRALSKDPALRPGSAQQVVLELQAVQAELGLPVTTVQLAAAPVPGPPAADAGDGAAEPTRLRPVRLLEPAPADPTVLRPPAAPPVQGSAWSGWDDTGSVDLTDTVVKHTGEHGEPVHEDSAPVAHGSRAAMVVGGAVVALGLLVGGVVLAVQLAGGGTSSPTPEPTPGPTGPGLGPGFVEQVLPPAQVAFTPAADGAVTVTWTAPAGADADTTYAVSLLDGAAVVGQQQVDSPTLTLPPGGPRCIDVRTVLADGRVSDGSAQGCAP